MTSVAGAEGAFWNPAGLAGAGRSQVVLFRGDQIAGTATALSTCRDASEKSRPVDESYTLAAYFNW
jgi:hypothetical protein